jgi:two-component system, LytTR family, sensor kinase
LFWIICILGWLALLFITGSSIYVAGFRSFDLAVKMTLAIWLPYVLLTPLVFQMARRYPLTFKSWRGNIGIHLGLCILFVVICESFFACTVTIMKPRIMQFYDTAPQYAPPIPFFTTTTDSTLDQQIIRMASVKAVTNIPLYWVLIAFAHTLMAAARLREREQQAAELTADLAQAHLTGLRTQLQPHFLFNTLNSISALIPHDAKLANEMVLNLSDLLRMTLRDPLQHEIPLSEELKILGYYVDIQKLRFGDRLQYRLEADESAASVLVPSLLLQPLVENAILYGIEPSNQPEQITVRVRHHGRTLSIEISNTARHASGAVLHPTYSTGVGLANTRARLTRLYGAKQIFSHGPQPEGGYSVQITITRKELT